MEYHNRSRSEETSSRKWTVSSVPPQALLAVARKAQSSAYAPYSGFRVGAAILGESGLIAAGGNIENASYSVSLCAERNAMSSFVSHSRDEKPVAVAIVAERGVPCYPCGACLQFLNEFNPDMLVLLESGNGSIIYTLRELLPHPFNLSEESSR